MASQTPYGATLLRHFFGDLLQRTMDAPTAAAHQQALQAFLEDVSPWVLPHEGIHLSRDSGVSVRYPEGLNSTKSSGTHQRTDRHHGIVG
jgi:hypothetical protein